MKIIQQPHSLLYARVFVSSWPAPLGSDYDLSYVRSFFGQEDFDFQQPQNIKQTIRNLLRVGGFSPSGRNKPACEYLTKAIEKEWFSPTKGINAAVDCCNAISLHSQLPISVIDLHKAAPPFSIQICEEDTSYIFNPSGQVLRADGLLAFFDQNGPCGTSVKDAQRTKTDEQTTKTLSIIWGHKDIQKYTDIVAEAYMKLQMDVHHNGTTVHNQEVTVTHSK
jgi:DNA/RNA-binding domain of Phe-tRNA-synthetase-like protein